MDHKAGHKSKITRTSVEYGSDTVSPLMKSIRLLIALSRLMSINAMEGVGATIEEVSLLTHLVDEVEKAAQVFDPEPGFSDPPL